MELDLLQVLVLALEHQRPFSGHLGWSQIASIRFGSFELRVVVEVVGHLVLREEVEEGRLASGSG